MGGDLNDFQDNFKIVYCGGGDDPGALVSNVSWCIKNTYGLRMGILTISKIISKFYTVWGGE